MVDFYRMTPLEVAWGWVGGFDTEGVDWPRSRPTSPNLALESLLLEALQRVPCVIEFSGGRDSSAVLAVAVEVARREGLDLPLPVTRIYPDVPESHESEWQKLVLRHLDIREWERVEVRNEVDILGPVGTRSLVQHGVVWPVTVHTRAQFWEIARGGTVVSGEGGDELFGRRRITPLTGLVARNVHPRRHAAAAAAKSMFPRPIRRSLASVRQGDLYRPWLTEQAQSSLNQTVLEDTLSEPFWWDRSIKHLSHHRARRNGLRNLKRLAETREIEYLAPFMEPTFINALATAGGRLGYPGRSAAMISLFGRLLPERVLRRESKAEFTRTLVGTHTRLFISGWQGGDVNTDLIDPDSLRLEWSASRPHAGTLPLLQATWLAANGH